LKDIFTAGIEEMPGLSFDCSCGRRHSVDIEKLVVRDGILEELIKSLLPFREEKLFILSDSNTYGVLGKNVIQKLEKEGFQYKSFVFEEGKHNLIPDERAVGRILIELEQETRLVLAIGSGVINDLARIISYRTNKPFAIVGTAPSMDGYASVVAPLIANGKKNTYQAKYPYAIFADTSIMSNAPMIMIQAGYGDIIGKLTALADWKLSNILTGEYYCETTAKLVLNGVDKCIESTDGLADRKETAIRCLIEALILTGISMGLVGTSRPASGTEHQLAHYWEVKAIEAGREHALHGNAVGAAAIVTAMLYELAEDILPDGIDYPAVERMTGLLGRIGAATNPRDIGVDRDLFIDSMMNAMNLRNKYTLLRFCYNEGKLKEFTETLTRRLYD